MSRRYDIDRVGNVAFQCLWGALVVTAILGCIFILSVGLSGCIYEDNADSDRRWGLRTFARILHTAMGGRIPDEVPHA